LKKRVNQRLKKLAKWSDSSSEERQSEFRVFRGSYGYTSSSSYRPAPPATTTPYRPPAYPSQAPHSIGRPFPSASNSYNPNSTIGIISNNLNNSSALSSNPSQRTSSFPLLASALAERAQHLEQKQTQPSQSSQPLQSQQLETPSVRKQLEQELQEKDSQREELIAKLQSELQQHQQEQKEETPAQEQEEREEVVDEIDPMEESVEEPSALLEEE
jgi:hypothetical protein